MFLAVSVVLGTLAALAILAQAWLIADIVSRAFIGREGLAQLRAPAAALLAVVLARAAIVWASELAANRASAGAKSELRGALLEHLATVGLDSARGQRTGELALLATRGVCLLYTSPSPRD